MKLLAKTSLYYLLLSIPVLVIAGWVCYVMITAEVRDSNNELLIKRKSQVERYIESNDTVSLHMISAGGEGWITAVEESLETKPVFSDTLIFDSAEQELASNRMLSASAKINNKSYTIRLWRSTLEFDELIEGIITSLIFIFIFLFLIFFLINWLVSRSLWKPFYKTIESLQSFRASDKVKTELALAKTKEFRDLNLSVNAMMDKMIADFKSQKEFTENASHEMQTPLAVIKAKIELLIQSEKLGEKETDLILGIEEACSKLARLNKSLLLLTKIENRQFVAQADVSLNKIIDEALSQYEEYLDAKKIELIKIFETEKYLHINHDLCEVLINNLIQNAIRHNIQNGSIEICLNNKQLSIINSGESKALNEIQIFDRFQKNNSSAESLGLGLAIAKEIAEGSGLSLKYHFVSDKHSFILNF